MARYTWSALNKQQTGAYAEYFVKMELTMCGFQVYTTEVDDRGIDFVARHETGRFIEVQVKSLRNNGYVFMQKTKFNPRVELYVAFVLLHDRQAPELYLIPSTEWRKPTGPFVERDYKGRKSAPEYGLNISTKNLPALAPYLFERAIQRLRDESRPASVAE